MLIIKTLSHTNLILGCRISPSHLGKHPFSGSTDLKSHTPVTLHILEMACVLLSIRQTFPRANRIPTYSTFTLVVELAWLRDTNWLLKP